MQPNVYILFSDTHAYCGELFAESGKFSHLSMTPAGERALGEHFEEWQVRGIPAMKDIVSAKHQSVAYTHDGRVLVRDPGFVQALREWLEVHGFRMLQMSMEALDCWETVLQLPLEPDEYYALAEDLALVPAEEVGAWKRTLQDAAHAAQLATV